MEVIPKMEERVRLEYEQAEDDGKKSKRLKGELRNEIRQRKLKEHLNKSRSSGSDNHEENKDFAGAERCKEKPFPLTQDEETKKEMQP